jgi:hypothetical protein
VKGVAPSYSARVAGAGTPYEITNNLIIIEGTGFRAAFFSFYVKAV